MMQAGNLDATSMLGRNRHHLSLRDIRPVQICSAPPPFQDRAGGAGEIPAGENHRAEVRGELQMPRVPGTDLAQEIP